MNTDNAKTKADGAESLSTAGLGAWIPIAEKQPENETRVLFCCAACDAGGGDVGIGFYLEEDRHLWLGEGGFWMPCPKAPNARLTGAEPKAERPS